MWGDRETILIPEIITICCNQRLQYCEVIDRLSLYLKSSPFVVSRDYSIVRPPDITALWGDRETIPIPEVITICCNQRLQHCEVTERLFSYLRSSPFVVTMTTALWGDRETMLIPEVINMCYNQRLLHCEVTERRSSYLRSSPFVVTRERERERVCLFIES